MSAGNSGHPDTSGGLLDDVPQSASHVTDHTGRGNTVCTCIREALVRVSNETHIFVNELFRCFFNYRILANGGMLHNYFIQATTASFHALIDPLYVVILPYNSTLCNVCVDIAA
jgi:hypothetical protein